MLYTALCLTQTYDVRDFSQNPAITRDNGRLTLEDLHRSTLYEELFAPPWYLGFTNNQHINSSPIGTILTNPAEAPFT